MRRRSFLRASGLSAGVLLSSTGNLRSGFLKSIILGQDDPRCEVRTERGAPRMFLNGTEVAPLMALGTSLLPTIKNFLEAGIRLYHPIIGLRWGWTGPNEYDWSPIEGYLRKLVDRHPDALFFPRLQLNTPSWWKHRHPDELIRYGLPAPEHRFDLVARERMERHEGGHFFRTGRELWEASFASQPWRDDTAAMLRSFIKHMDGSDLRQHMIGYFMGHGRTGEWNYFGATFFPDYGDAMARKCATIPSVAERMDSSFGLLRDPAKEANVIEFYRCYHATVAETVAELAQAIKEQTDRKLLCGTFFAYLTECVRAQDAGYLVPWTVLDSPDIDVIACPYAYQSTNVEGSQRWESDMEDGAGNALGRARGVGGDGAFRAMVESIKRRGKLYVSEIDPSTYLDVTDSWRSIGGSGSQSVEGTIRILRRDLGKVVAEGVGGWLYDFGPLHGVETGWYGDDPIIEEFKIFRELLEKRLDHNIGSVAEVAVLADPESLIYTRHWLAEKPWSGYGIRWSDLFNHWFLNAQSRAILRMGVPVDWLYWHDLTEHDLERYRLLIVPNVFYATLDRVERMRSMLLESGVTVLWYYAPGFVADGGLELDRMNRLTGFSFETIHFPGPMMIETAATPVEVLPNRFGIKSDAHFWPRFAVRDSDAEVLGHWEDRRGDVAFARRTVEGWSSIYVGTAPLPVDWLRHFAMQAGVSLWSSRPDIVSAVEDVAMLVATSSGARTFTPRKPLRLHGETEMSSAHTLEMETGDVQMLTAW